MDLLSIRRPNGCLVEVFNITPGLEDVRLIRTAPTMGVRETRRICGQYRLTIDDLAAGRRFEDAVTFCRFGIDIHEPAPDSGIDKRDRAPIKPDEIPYRCLLAMGIENLLVASRCISGSHEAHASYRVTGTCMGMGQAAGLAAAHAVQQGKTPARLSGSELRGMLQVRGVEFLPNSTDSLAGDSLLLREEV